MGGTILNRGALLAAATIIATMAIGGSAQALTVTPGSKEFGLVTVGSSSPPQGFVLSTSQPSLANPIYTVDTSDLRGGPGTSTTIDSYFLVHNLDCPYPQLSSSLGTAGSCNFEVSFAPTTFSSSFVVYRYLLFKEQPDNGTGLAAVSFTGTAIGPPSSNFVDPPESSPKAAIAKCKKKFPKGPKRKKCNKRARQKAAALS
jgi:hypothetical protein